MEQTQTFESVAEVETFLEQEIQATPETVRGISGTEFLSAIYKNCSDGDINLRFIYPQPRGKVDQYFIGRQETDFLPSILEIFTEQHCYFAVATRLTNNGTKSGIVQIPALWCDLDYKDITPEDAIAEIKSFIPQPTFTVHTGGGLHVYWLLKNPVNADSIPRVEELLDRICLRLKGDFNATDASRVLRIPGTTNWKYEPPSKVRVLAYNLENEYTLEDFEFLPRVTEDKRKENKLDWVKEIIGGVEDGNRHTAMAQLAGRYISKGMLKDEILLILIGANAGFKPPLPYEDIEKTLDSVLSTDLRNHPLVVDRANFTLANGAELLTMPEEEIIWFWDGILPSGGLSLLLAKPKVGKTVFAFNLAVKASQGVPFLGRNTQQGKVIYLALEENKGEVIKNLRAMGGDVSNISFHFGMAPEDAIRKLVILMEEKKPILVVVDILQKLIRVKKIEDYAETISKIEPLMDVGRRINCHILLTHHAPKQERELVDSPLGSTGLAASVDSVLLITKKDKRRAFSTLQRYRKNNEEDIDKWVLELQEDGITIETHGTISEVDICETKDHIMRLIENIGEGRDFSEPLTEPQIRDEVKKDRNFVLRMLRELFKEGKLHRTGNGRKNDPYRYSQSASGIVSSYLKNKHSGEDCLEEQ